MPTRKAVVQGGRAIIEDVDFPDGTELEVTIVSNDEMTAEERERLHASLDRGLAQAEAGQAVPGSEVIEELRARGR